MSGRLSNVDNSHPFYGGSNQGMVTGCTGGAIGPNGNCNGIVQARGIVGNQRGGANAPNAIGDFPTAEGQEKASQRGIKSFLAVNNGGQSGGGYGFTTKNAVLRQNIPAAVSPTSNCERLSPSFKMGAGQIYHGTKSIQKGGSRSPLAPTASDFFNQSTSVGYGYKSGDDNLLFAGSGYPKETSTTAINTCQRGGRRRRKTRRKRKRHSKRHSKRKSKRRSKRKRHSKHPKKGKASRTRKGRLDFVTHKGDKAYNRSGHRQYKRRKPYTKKRKSRRGGFLCGLNTHPKKGQKSRTRKGYLDFITHRGDKDFNEGNRRQKRVRKPYTKKKNTKRRSRGQRGGSRYVQFQSNVPLALTMQTPNGPQGGSWNGQLATPPTYKIVNNCQDNYNHYKK